MAHYISDFSLLHLVDFYAVWPDAGIKINPSFPVRAQTVTKVIFYYIVTKCFKIAQKASKYLDHVDEKICCQELSKIAQSGHTSVRTCRGLNVKSSIHTGAFYAVSMLV